MSSLLSEVVNDDIEIVTAKFGKMIRVKSTKTAITEIDPQIRRAVSTDVALLCTVFVGISSVP